MKPLALSASTLIACLVAGCASQPPVELRNARAAYQDAANSPGATLAQTDVYEAKKSLGIAEQAFKDNGDAAETRDLAYVAERKAIAAKSNGNTDIALQQRKQAMADAEAWKAQQAVATRQQLGAAKNQLAMTQEQLAAEKQARAAADQRTADALAKIAGMTTKQDTRGLVLTLNGSVLFAFGKSELLPRASSRLNDIVKALKEDKRSITVIGYTDSVGSDATNQALSQARAESVRTYLVGHGVPDDRVQAKGMGKSDPIATNDTAEGRANNRRVEIVLAGKPDTEGTPINGRSSNSGPNDAMGSSNK